MMRSGVKPDGVAFPPGMPWQVAAQLTDADMAALHAYLTVRRSEKAASDTSPMNILINCPIGKV